MSLVSILRTGDPVALGFAKEILGAEKIPFEVRGEFTQHLIGLGTFGSGFNPVTGPAELLVNEEDAVKTRELLQDYISNNG